MIIRNRHIKISPMEIIHMLRDVASNVLDKTIDDIIEMDEMPIGIRIKAELKRQECSVSWLARKINCHRVNIYDIFQRRDIDVKLLVRISIALKHNFIEDYYNEVESHIDEE